MMLPTETRALASGVGEHVIQTSPPPGFDPTFLISQIIPLIGAVAAMIIGGVVLYAFFKSDLAKAMAERIRAELAERLDFAERLLAQKRERSLPGA